MTKKRVLVVDDRPAVADALVFLIKTLGHPAQAVYGGREALKAVQDHRASMIFLDLDMPGMDGFETARYLRQRHGDSLCLIAHSGRSGDKKFHNVKNLGFDHYLSKPASLEAIEALLHEEGFT